MREVVLSIPKPSYQSGWMSPIDVPVRSFPTIATSTLVPELHPDQWIYVRFGSGPKGQMAAEVRLTLDNGPRHTN